MRVLLISLLLLSAITNAAPTATLTIDSSAGLAPLSANLTWSSSGATSCTASSVPAIAGWSGNKALSGTQAITITDNTTLTLQCGTAALSYLVTNWTAPVTNTDGTPITGTLTYNLYQKLANGTYQLVSNTPNRTLTVGPFAAGTWTFAVASLTTQTIGSQTFTYESIKTNDFSGTTTAAEYGTSSVQVGVLKKPNAPANPTATAQ